MGGETEMRRDKEINGRREREREKQI